MSLYFNRVGNLLRDKQESAASISLMKLREEFKLQVKIVLSVILYMHNKETSPNYLPQS